MGALRDLPLRMERRDGGSLARRRRHLLGRHFRGAGGADRGETRRTANALYRAILWRPRNDDRGSSPHRARLLRFHSGDDDLDDLRPRRSRDDDAARERIGTGRTTRGHQQFTESRSNRWPRPLHICLRTLHRSETRLECAGRALVSRRGVALRRHADVDSGEEAAAFRSVDRTGARNVEPARIVNPLSPSTPPLADS